MKYGVDAFYRALVRRKGDRWWARVPSSGGQNLTFELTTPQVGGADHTELIHSRVPESVRELLSTATLIRSTPHPLESESHIHTVLNAEFSPGTILDLCWPQFLDHEGCIFMADSPSELPALSLFSDRTGAEAFVNHVHLDDIFRSDNGELSYKFSEHECLIIAQMWMYKLHLEFPNSQFAVYLFAGSDDSHLRFHTVRESEPLWADLKLLFDDCSDSISVWFI